MVGVTAIIAPLIRLLYDPSKQYLVLKKSTIQHIKREAEFKIMICIQTPDSVPTVINVLEASHATQDNPISITAIILIELVGTVNPVLTAAYKPEHNLRESTSTSVQILNALRQYELQNEGCASVYSFTSVSRYETMHDDVCRVALNSRSNIVIVPFHKRWTIDGSVGMVNRGIQSMNLVILERAPCSVGILIDRGVMAGASTLLTTNYLYHVAVIFIGGADDAESLAYGSRMATHERVNLTVARFLLFGAENSKERKRDSDLLNEYRQANAGNEKFMIVEEVVRDALGLSNALKDMVGSFDLILVGRHHDDSELILGLAEWNECPELGIIGDMLSSSDFGGSASILVIQQHRLGHKPLSTRALKTLDKERTSHEVSYDEASKASWSINVDRNDNRH